MRAAHSSRRVALFFRLDPSAAARALPLGARARVVRGRALGVTLVAPPASSRSLRLGLPVATCVHGIVTDRSEGPICSGLTVLRRDVDLRWLGPAGGLSLPGAIHGARIDGEWSEHDVRVSVEPKDQDARLELWGRPAPEWPQGSLFQRAAEAAQQIGVRCKSVQPLELVRARDAWFEASAHFADGCVELDSAAVLQDLVSIRSERHNGRRQRRPFVAPAADAAPA